MQSRREATDERPKSHAKKTPSVPQTHSLPHSVEGGMLQEHSGSWELSGIYSTKLKIPLEPT